MSSDPSNLANGNADPANPPPASASLDAYAVYLGLPDGPRPPHLYQLLQIELFCPHPERIEAAVRKQFRRVKPFAEHPNRAIRERIQDLMSHIATARVTLIDPEQKQLYDTKLAQRLGVDRAAVLASRPAERAPDFELIILAGPRLVGERIALLPDRPVRIGADYDCELTLPSLRMPQLHAQLQFENDSWRCRAIDTTAPLLINDARTEEASLSPGDVLEFCGYRLAFVPYAMPATPDAGPKQGPSPLALIVREGPSVAEPHFFAIPPAEILIGQCETTLWRLDNGRVSRHHARIAPQGGLWEIRDLQSKNGVWLNDERIDVGVLRHRDNLRIGPFEISVTLRR